MRIRKTSTTTPVQAEIINVDSDSQTNAYSCNYINSKFDENRYFNNFRYYIDGVNGNDDNDGLTSETAFKTLDKFLEQSNTKGDIRCYITSAGVYTFSKKMLVDTTVHITGNVSGIIINNPNDTWTFYHCHLNLENITLRYNGNEDAYIEDGSLVTNNCVIECPYKGYNANINLKNTTINQIRLEASRFYCENLIIDGKNKDNYTSGIAIVRSSIAELNSITFKTLTEKNVSRLLYTYGSFVSIHGTLTFESQNTYNYGNAVCNYSSISLNETNYYQIIDTGYKLTGTKMELSNVKIRDNDITVLNNIGSLSGNKSYYDGTTIHWLIELSGVDLPTSTTDLVTVPSYLAPGDASTPLIITSNDKTSMTYGWITTTGTVRASAENALTNKSVRIMGTYTL